MNTTTITMTSSSISSSSNDAIEISTTLSIVQIVISSCVFIGLFILVAGVLSNKKTRQQPFNIYLISLELVDLIMNGLLVATYVWALFNHHQHNQQHPGDEEQISSSSSNNTNNNLDEIKVVWITTDTIVIFATFVNVYMSGIVAYQIHRLLNSTNRCLRVKPPTKVRIIIESSIVYCLGFALAAIYSWSSVATSKGTMNNAEEETDEGGGSIEDDNNNNNGDGGGLSTAKIAWIVCCGILLLPLSYILYVTIQIYQKKLLSLSLTDRRTRKITIYFGRVVFVFIAFYLPGTIFFALGVSSVLLNDGIITKEGWTNLIIGTIIFALQGAFSFVVALTKDDIRDAVIVFLQIDRCRKSRRSENNNNNNNGVNDNDRRTYDNDVECGKRTGNNNNINRTVATTHIEETQSDEIIQNDVEEKDDEDEVTESFPEDDDPILLPTLQADSQGHHERNIGLQKAGSERLSNLSARALACVLPTTTTTAERASF